MAPGCSMWLGAVGSRACQPHDQSASTTTELRELKLSKHWGLVARPGCFVLSLHPYLLLEPGKSSLFLLDILNSVSLNQPHPIPHQPILLSSSKYSL